MSPNWKEEIAKLIKDETSKKIEPLLPQVMPWKEIAKGKYSKAKKKKALVSVGKIKPLLIRLQKVFARLKQ